MGCGPSKETVKKKNNNTENKCLTCLVFGMPECGQSIFVKAMERYLGNMGYFNENFSFVIAPQQREKRVEWVNQYSQPRVIASYFFVDVSSHAATLLSIKTLNWLQSQLVEHDPPFVVGYIKNQMDESNFAFLKSNLSPKFELAAFFEKDETDIKKFIENIKKSYDNYNKTHIDK